MAARDDRGAHDPAGSEELLRQYAGYLVDMDGVLLRGTEPIAGSVRALALLQSMARVILVTNNSTRSRQELSASLEAHRFSVPPEDIITSAYAASQKLFDDHGPVAVWPVGERGLREELLACGHRLVADPTDAEWVVAGMDRHLTYGTLADALIALDGGARLLATNEDETFPIPQGRRPGAGAVVGAMRGMGYAPEIVIGKPEAILFQRAMARARVPAAETLMVGDRLETDMLGASRCGVDGLLVLSGISTLEDVQRGKIAPTWIADTLAHAVDGKARRWARENQG